MHLSAGILLCILCLSPGAASIGIFLSGFSIAGTHGNTPPSLWGPEAEVAAMLGGQVHPLTLSFIWGLTLIINLVDTGIVDGAMRRGRRGARGGSAGVGGSVPGHLA